MGVVLCVAPRFVRIISPRNASSVQAKQETGSAKIVLVLRYGQPMVVKEANPEVRSVGCRR